jgi:hypothetical protein
MKNDVIQILKDNQNDIRFLLDSGAFTAWKAGKPIHLDDYCRFIESLPFKPWRYFTLDVIGDPHASLKNYETMLKRGFNPIPIFTRGEDIKMIDEYYKTSDVVGIGGLVGTPGNKGFVKGIMNVIGNRKVHWLGFTEKNFVKHFKPFSCDSSSLTMAGRFASVELFDKKNGQWIKIGKDTFIVKPKPEIKTLIESYGFNITTFSQKSNWHEPVGLSMKLSFKSHVRASIEYHKRLNVFYFLAPIGSVVQPHFNRILDAYNEETKQ